LNVIPFPTMVDIENPETYTWGLHRWLIAEGCC
jgi:hypothetical protein